METPNQWIELYNKPDPGFIFGLSAKDFRDFVAYIFERAGFHVEPYTHPGADLELRNENRIIGYVATSSGVVHVGPNPVQALNGMAGDRDAMRYYISSDGFTDKAIEAARDMEQLRLIDITRLQRFINYVRGTRHPKSKNMPLSPQNLFDREPQKRPTQQTKVMVLANNKGGVSKTTSALIIATILGGEKDKRVLLVDLDDQANLTQAATGEYSIPGPNISDYFIGDTTLARLIQPSRFKNVWVIPSAPELRLTLTNVTDWTKTEKQFTDDLHHPSVALQDNTDFDWIIIDTPPALSLYTRAALLASHYVLVPFTPSTLGLAGLKNILETLSQIKDIASGANQTQVLGCFAARWKKSNANQEDVARLRDAARGVGAPLKETDIDEDSNNVRKITLPEFSGNAQRMHGAFDDYRRLVKEIQNDVGDN